MEINLPPGYIFLNVSESMIATAVRRWGVSVFRSARPSAKMPTDSSGDRRKWQALGAFARTQMVNLSVKPQGRSLADFDWHMHRKIEIKVHGSNVALDYRLGGNGSEERHSSYTGCKKFKDECQCEQEKAAASVADMGVRRAASQGKREVGAEKRSQAFTAFASMYCKKSKRICPFLRTGMCVRGKACKMVHEGEAQNWATIECHLERSAGHKCAARGNCIYNPCVRMNQQEASSSSNNCECTLSHHHHPPFLEPPSIEGEAIT